VIRVVKPAEFPYGSAFRPRIPSLAPALRPSDRRGGRRDRPAYCTGSRWRRCRIRHPRDESKHPIPSRPPPACRALLEAPEPPLLLTHRDVPLNAATGQASNGLCSVVPSCEGRTPIFMVRAGVVWLRACGDSPGARASRSDRTPLAAWPRAPQFRRGQEQRQALPLPFRAGSRAGRGGALLRHCTCNHDRRQFRRDLQPVS
jgi:hypothetical protein